MVIRLFSWLFGSYYKVASSCQRTAENLLIESFHRFYATNLINLLNQHKTSRDYSWKSSPAFSCSSVPELFDPLFSQFPWFYHLRLDGRTWWLQTRCMW